VNIHLRYKTFHLDASLHRRQPVLGVNSILPDGSHFLMWDFDKVELKPIIKHLEELQSAREWSTIYILVSSVPGNYHAYCFHKVTWGELVHVLLDTPGIDKQYVKLGVMRGYMTLRFTDKKNSQIRPYMRLDSVIPPTAEISDIRNFEAYWTKDVKHVNGE
jgi:hypothetical protein